MSTQSESNRGQGAAGEPDAGRPHLPHELLERLSDAAYSYDPKRIPPSEDVYQVETLDEIGRRYLSRFRVPGVSGDRSHSLAGRWSVADDHAVAEREYWDLRIDLEQAEMARERARDEAKAAKGAAKDARRATRKEAKGAPAPPQHRRDHS